MLWIACGLVGLATVAPRVEDLVEAPRPQAVAADEVAIPRAPDGQFYADIRIGDVMIQVLVDAGAEHMLLAGDDARRLGLPGGAGFAPVVLPRVAIGSLAKEQVAAVIAPDLPVSLLGRSYLSRLSAVAIEPDRMILR